MKRLLLIVLLSMPGIYAAENTSIEASDFWGSILHFYHDAGSDKQEAMMRYATEDDRRLVAGEAEGLAFMLDITHTNRSDRRFKQLEKEYVNAFQRIGSCIAQYKKEHSHATNADINEHVLAECVRIDGDYKKINARIKTTEDAASETDNESDDTLSFVAQYMIIKAGNRGKGLNRKAAIADTMAAILDTLDAQAKRLRIDNSGAVEEVDSSDTE